MELTLSKNSSRTFAEQTFLVLLFAGLTAAGAMVEIPLWPVPVTMQTCFVLMSGALIGSRLGAISQIVYLAAGIFLPVYSGGATGIATLLGPTGGYLFSFPVAAFVCGWLVKNETQLAKIFAFVLLASVINFTMGVVWLKISLALSWQTAMMQGVVPFIVGDLIKCGIVAAAASVKQRFIK
ncbi:MAG: biotin transporter BioY [Rhizobacter sp.]|nr:biotin transporter BioY [Chlorobiales bacterium]